MGYFHVKFLSVPTRIQRGIFSCSVPERANADSAWDIFHVKVGFLSLSMQNQRGDIFLSSQHVNIRDYKELFPVITYWSCFIPVDIVWIYHTSVM